MPLVPQAPEEGPLQSSPVSTGVLWSPSSQSVLHPGMEAAQHGTRKPYKGFLELLKGSSAHSSQQFRTVILHMPQYSLPTATHIANFILFYIAFKYLNSIVNCLVCVKHSSKNVIAHCTYDNILWNFESLNSPLTVCWKRNAHNFYNVSINMQWYA